MRTRIKKTSQETFLCESVTALSMLIVASRNKEVATSDFRDLGLTSPNAKGKLSPIRMLVERGLLSKREKDIPNLTRKRNVYSITKRGEEEIAKCVELGMEEFYIPSLSMFFRYKKS